MSGEKTEEPSQKKLDDARKKGQVWKSKDLTGVFGFIVGLGVVKSTWPNVETRIKELFQFSFDHIAHPQGLETATFQLIALALNSVIMLSLPIVASVAVMGSLLDFLQVGSLFTMDPLLPKLEKLNPIEGLKNLISKKQIVELIKNLAKISIAAYLAFGVVRDSMPMVVETVRGDTQLTLAVMGEMVYRLALRVGMAFFLFAIFDVWWQRKAYMKDQMMSKEDVKKEYKESEGDPHHKGQRRAAHRQLAAGGLSRGVKTASVVVVNPTHLAIALRYDQGECEAPYLVGKGRDAEALALRREAERLGIPVVRDVPLARGLVQYDVGEEIPEELYQAAAAVLRVARESWT